MKTNSILLIALHQTDSNMMMLAGSYWARQPLWSLIHVAHSHWPWLSETLHIFTTLLHSPTPSRFSCPLPVIACQINVPLCSQAQTLSCLIQPLLPSIFWFGSLSYWYNNTTTTTTTTPLGLPFLLCHCVSLSLAYSLPMFTPASSLSCFLQTPGFLRCAALAVLLAVSLPWRWQLTLLYFHLFQPVHLLACASPSSY